MKDASTIDTDGLLSPDEEQELYRYYDIGGDIGRTTDVDEYTWPAPPGRPPIRAWAPA